MLGYVAGGMALLGALAGGQKDRRTQRIAVEDPTALETQSMNLSGAQLKDLENLIKAGPGQAEITAAQGEAGNLTALLQRLQSTGGIASGAELEQARAQSAALFAPEQVAMQQAFEDQRIQANRRAAGMGRTLNDPILMNKLAQEQTRQQQMLQARHTQYAAQAPQRQLDLAGRLFDVRQGLASQALANRQTLFAMGQQALSAERQFRLGKATTTTEGGGGMGGAISGAMAGAGGALSMYNQFQQGNWYGARANALASAPSSGSWNYTTMNENLLDWGGGGEAPAPRAPSKPSFSSSPLRIDMSRNFSNWGG